VATPQQKARQREEHRNGQVEPAEQPPRDPAGVACLKGDMRDDDADGGARAHPLEGGQETTSPAHG
jgi:hypothetical protein